MVRNKNLLLFLLVCGSTFVFLSIGWGIGVLMSDMNAAIGASLGATLGSIVGVEIGFYRGYVEADWDRLLWVTPFISVGILGGIAAMNNLSSINVAICAVLGAGLGSLAAKYMLRFFIQEPPTSILK